MKKVSFVIPVFRNQQSLIETANEIIQLFKNEIKDTKLEILFVDDGSDDSSLEIIEKLSLEHENINFIASEKNVGQVAAIIMGIKQCSGDAVIVKSADLQDPIQLVSEMILKWELGCGVVICTRSSREDSWFNSMSSLLFYSMVKCIFSKMPIGGFDYFLLDRFAIDKFNKIECQRRFLQGDILNLSNSIAFIPFKRLLRVYGKSQWTIKKKVNYAMDAFSFASWNFFILSFAIIIPYGLLSINSVIIAVNHNQVSILDCFNLVLICLITYLYVNTLHRKFKKKS
jgi:glycosyltransferase involved in cell wall biosynthesis